MRALVPLLALTACVDAGESLRMPNESFELAFLVWVNAGQITASSEAFETDQGEVRGLSMPNLRRREGEALVLITLGAEDLRAATPLFDPARKLESRLRVASDGVCEKARFSSDRRQVERPLPSTAVIRPLAPATVVAGSLEPLRAQLRITLPLADRACEPPGRTTPFALDGVAIAAGVVLGGVARQPGVDGSASFFELRDAVYASPNEALVVFDSGVFVLPRGGRMRGDDDPSLFTVDRLRTVGMEATQPTSLAVLPAHSDEIRQRFLVIWNEHVDGRPRRTWASTVEREGNELVVLGSTVAAGVPVRPQVDAQGRVIFGGSADEEGSEAESTLLWTRDGLEFESRKFSFAMGGIAVTKDPAHPHIIYEDGPAAIRLGDLSGPPEDEWVVIGLDQTFFDGIRSVASTPVGTRSRIVIGGEGRAARMLDFPPQSPEGPVWVPIDPVIDAATSAAGCGDLPNQCNDVQLPSELDQLTAFTPADGPSWFFTLTKLCAHVHAIREDGCTTHLPLEPIIPIREARSMLSIRVSRDETRALVAGRAGRLFELELLR